MTSHNNSSLEESKHLIYLNLIVVLNYIRQNLLKNGYDKLRILGKNFREMPSYDGFNKVNRDEFLVVLRDLGILIPKYATEVNIIFIIIKKLVQYYDMDIDGCVNFDDFLLGIRGKPNEIRQSIIDEAFSKFDFANQGSINFRDLK